MSQQTSIEWTEQTWGVVHGCTKVSAGCRNCYAETLSLRYGHTNLPWTKRNEAENVILKPHKLTEPLKRRKPTMYFVNSMSDLWHELVPASFIEGVFAVMALTPRHTYQILTKRTERMRELLNNPGFHLNVLTRRWHLLGIDGPTERHLFLEANPEHPIAQTCPWPLPNVWLGVSIENRKWVGRADLLRDTPAAVRFISAEPLLGPLVAESHHIEMPGRGDSLRDEWWEWSDGYEGADLCLRGIDWLIVGGESGPRHRPMNIEWARDLVEVARLAGAAPFVKQLGGARPGTRLEDLPADLRIREFPQVSL